MALINANFSLNGFINGTTSSVAGCALAAMDGGLRGSNNYVRILGAGIQKQMGNPADMEKAHREVAAAMRTSVIKSFEQTVKTRSGVYRVGDNRLSGGRLKTALRQDSLAEGTPFGINFVDAGRLDEEAAHWRRLNFGARGTGVPNRTIKSFAFKFDGVSLFRVRFTNPSSKPFSLPPGRFMNGGKRVPYSAGERGRDQFFPGGAGRNNIPVTRGIEPNEFLNAGLATMVALLPPRYTLLVDTWLDRAETAAVLPKKQIIRTFQDRNGRWASTGD